jgi:Ca-activated chloride channel homolog
VITQSKSAHSRIAVFTGRKSHPRARHALENTPQTGDRSGAVWRCPHLGAIQYRVACIVAITLMVMSLHAQQRPPTHDGAVFKSEVELVNVNATVRDAHGDFVSGLSVDDFVVYEDDEPQTVTQFGARRVPVSLGIALDSSSSMVGEKLQLAKGALDSLLYALFSPEDEFFLYGFSDHPVLLQGWTGDRSAIMRSLDHMIAGGNTALYDVMADAVPRAQQGRNTRRALVLVSDGSDNKSTNSIQGVKDIVRATETLVYAIGIDCRAKARPPASQPRQHQAIPPPLPFPFPRCADPVDAATLRQITDDSGGRTEIVDNPRGLERAANGIADELSKQYYLGYSSPAKKDGRWHSIRVETRRHTYRVRARSGYVAK